MRREAPYQVIEKKNEISTFQWALWGVTCMVSTCGAVAAAVAVVILISQHWGGVQTTTA